MTANEILIEVDDGRQVHRFSCKPGLSLMEAIRNAGLPLEAACGGSLACATCHVVVSNEDYDRVGEPGEDEEDMLDQAFGVTRTSRLGCQILLSPALDGLRLRLPARS
ncbi:2Fe-2S iron-sulfur cluster-binding protein [Hyphomicrobium sp.]|uniref:2Fe-2S iron-sulfur cluster-binding protein n=1 Tax=Hyphomicrobium sp. TaxID=82 RepID=UPI002FE02FDA